MYFKLIKNKIKKIGKSLYAGCHNFDICVTNLQEQNFFFRPKCSIQPEFILLEVINPVF